MSAPGFTPGPWHTERPFGEPGLYVAAKSSALVAKVYEERDVNEQRIGVTADANAALLAAAPDLYAALRDAYEALHDIINASGNDDPYTREELEGEFSDIAGNAWAALEKAEGREA